MLRHALSLMPDLNHRLTCFQRQALPEPLKNRIVAQVQALPGVEIVTPRPLPSLMPCRLSFVVFPLW